MAIVTIVGKVLLPDGNGPSSGSIVATLSANASVGDDRVVARKRFAIPSGGDLALADPAVTLHANDGLSPANTFYDIEYVLLDADGTAHGKRELWQMTGSGSQSIGSISTIMIPSDLVINGLVPYSGADYPAAALEYRGALRRRKRAGRPEEMAICLENHDASTYTWKELADGEP